MNNKIQVISKDLVVFAIRYLLCFKFPPLAVIDKGMKIILLVLLFTLFGWLPGVYLAFFICMKERNYFVFDK